MKLTSEVLISSVSHAAAHSGETAALIVLAELMDAPRELAVLQAIATIVRGEGHTPFYLLDLQARTKDVLMRMVSRLYGPETAYMLGRVV